MVSKQGDYLRKKNQVQGKKYPTPLWQLERLLLLLLQVISFNTQIQQSQQMYNPNNEMVNCNAFWKV